MHGARNIGGGEYSLYFLIKRLRKDIFEPLVFYSNENEIIKRIREDGIRLVNIPLDKKITSIYRDEIKKNPVSLLIYAWHLITGIFKVARAVKEFQVDILHPHDNLSKIIGGMAAKIAGIKAVAHCRDLLKGSPIEKMLIFFQLLFMDKIIAVSESNRVLFKIWKKIPAKVQTIYNGIDFVAFDSTFEDNAAVKKALNINNEQFVIGIIGVFDKCKGHIYLFKAIERLVSDGIKNVLCLVVGAGREEKELKGFVVNKRLQDYFMFLGYRSDIPELLKAIDVVVMPSIQESFPRVPLEAMAMKVPVIASTVGGLSESVEDGKTGLLVQPADVDSLCKAVKHLIDYPEMKKKMGEASRGRVEERFSIESNVRKTEKLYMEVIEHRS